MNRRSFLQIIAAAAALPVFPKIKPVRRVVGFEWNGFTFMEDPNPLRFILTPEGYEEAPPVYEWQRETAGLPVIFAPEGRVIPNPAWQTALQPAICFHPDAVRRFEGCGPKVGVKGGPRRA